MKRSFSPQLEQVEKRDVPSGVLSGYSVGSSYVFSGGNAINFNNTVNNMSAYGVYLGQGQIAGSVQRAGNGDYYGGLSLNFGRYQLAIAISETSPGSVIYNYVVVGDDMGVPAGSYGQFQLNNFYSSDIMSF